MVPGEGTLCSLKTLAGLHPWVSEVCNFMTITYSFLAFHWALYFPHFRSKPLSPHHGGVSFSLSPPTPISKVRRQRRKPCHSGPWNARCRVFKWLVAKSSDLRASGIFFLFEACCWTDLKCLWSFSSCVWVDLWTDAWHGVFEKTPFSGREYPEGHRVYLPPRWISFSLFLAFLDLFPILLNRVSHFGGSVIFFHFGITQGGLAGWG